MATAGRERFRWLLLLVAAVLLVAWLLVDGTGEEPGGGDGSSASSPSSSPSSPTHRLTSTTTPTTDPAPSPTADGQDPGGVDPASGLPVVRLAGLPPQAAATVGLIDRGGPYPEPEHDGGTFENREEILPDRPLGYYREYTVPTPGSDDRGARRIVAGADGELYWTGDHYRSFSRIAR